MHLKIFNLTSIAGGYFSLKLQQKSDTLVSDCFGMGEGGFEPPKAVPADLQSVPFGHSGIPPYSVPLGFGFSVPLRTLILYHGEFYLSIPKSKKV